MESFSSASKSITLKDSASKVYMNKVKCRKFDMFNQCFFLFLLPRSLTINRDIWASNKYWIIQKSNHTGRMSLSNSWPTGRTKSLGWTKGTEMTTSNWIIIGLVTDKHMHGCTMILCVRHSCLLVHYIAFAIPLKELEKLSDATFWREEDV